LLRIKEEITLRDYQIDASNFATSRPASLLSLKTGTGKSLISINASANLLNEGKVKKAIFICTKTSLIEVDNDLRTKLEYDDGSSFQPFIITDNESLREFYRNEEHDITLLQYEKIHQLDLALLFKCLSKIPTLVICDESHKLKTPSALLTKSIVAVRRAIKYLVFLTATPITTNLLDLFNQIQILDKLVFKNKNQFINNFIEMKMVKNWKTGRQYPEVGGYKNLELLRSMLKDICFDYYPQQNTEYIIHKTKIENVDEYVSASEGLLKSEDSKEYSARFVDLQHVVDKSREKLKLFAKAISPHYKDGLIVYCHYRETISIISRVLDRLNFDYETITGETSTKDRKRIKEWFNSCPQEKVLIISNAGGQSANLQSVNNLFFYDMPQGFGAFSQAKGRIERLFSKHSDFKIHFILTEIEYNGNVTGTVDLYKYELISSYGELTETVLKVDKIPKGNLTSFNKSLINKMKQSMLWKKSNKRIKKI